MEKICTRCSRLALRSQRQLYCTIKSDASKAFSTSAYCRAEDGTKPVARSKPQAARPTETPAKTPTGTTPINKQPQLLIRRVAHGSNQSDGRPPVQLLRRSGASGPPGTPLRRTGPPGPGAGTRERGAQRPGQGQDRKAVGRSQRRRAMDNEFDTADDADLGEGVEKVTSDDIDEYMDAYIDPPQNPTQRIQYNPAPQEMSELQKDWPNTPLSATGLSATVIQKLESLAGRLPHGYQTPGQLADDFVDGKLMRFESEEEKKKVIEIATELAKKRANELSERKGSDISAEDMTLADLSSGNQQNKILNEVVKGEIGQLERQRMPFLDSVMRNLRNNQSYHQTEMAGFMATVQKLMPAQSQRRPPQQQTQKS